jgi:hypothetical protein
VVDGELIEVKCRDDDQMNSIARQWVKGEVVEVAVELQPSYGAPRGTSVEFFAPGAFSAMSRDDWK